MDFAALVLFLVFYQLKPQEWFPWMQDLRPVQVIMAIGLLGLMSRDRPFRIQDLFRTPHDLLMMMYIGWIIFVSPEPFQEFKDFQIHIVTYFVTVHALTNVQRMQKLFFWWSIILMAVVILALLPTIGFDLRDSNELSTYRMKGRLVLNISIYSNPNTLAHSVLPVLPMLYFIMFWRRLLAKALAVITALPIYCIFLTQSKGAFVSAFATLVTMLTFGRPKMIQIAILAFALTSGVGALYMLPRMTELDKTKTDPAIQGRVEALKFGLRAMRSSSKGIGPGNFVPAFTKEFGYRKAAHNSYNQNGAELGPFGLCLFLALLYSCGRTLITAKTGSISEERVRRLLFTLLVTYCVSSWMVDFGYRTAFFVMVGATGAFHRLISGINDEIAVELTREEEEGILSPFAKRSLEQKRKHQMEAAMSIPLLGPVPLGASAPISLAQAPRIMPGIPLSSQEEPEPGEHDQSRPRSLRWRRFGLIDIGMTYILYKLTVRFWIHLISTM